MTGGQQATPLHMHTDMQIGEDDHGYWFIAKNPSGVTRSVLTSPGIATMIGQAAGLSGPPATTPNPPAPVNPFHMHTDAQTKATANGDGTVVTVTGPADKSDGTTVTLQWTIDGPALEIVKGHV